MTSKRLVFMVLLAVFLGASVSVVNEAVPMPIADAAAEAQNKPVVAPVPNGVDPSSPEVAGEAPSEVLTSTPTTNATTTNNGY